MSSVAAAVIAGVTANLFGPARWNGELVVLSIDFQEPERLKRVVEESLPLSRMGLEVRWEIVNAPSRQAVLDQLLPLLQPFLKPNDHVFFVEPISANPQATS